MQRIVPGSLRIARKVAEVRFIFLTSRDLIETIEEVVLVTMRSLVLGILYKNAASPPF